MNNKSDYKTRSRWQERGPRYFQQKDPLIFRQVTIKETAMRNIKRLNIERDVLKELQDGEEIWPVCELKFPNLCRVIPAGEIFKKESFRGQQKISINVDGRICRIGWRFFTCHAIEVYKKMTNEGEFKITPLPYIYPYGDTAVSIPPSLNIFGNPTFIP